MPSVIDSLVVMLGLDASGFKKGSKDATEALGKTKEASVKVGKDIEKSASDAKVSVGALKGAFIELFAAFTAGKSLKNFIADVTLMDAETGRVAKTLGTTTEKLSAWQGAAAQFGDSAGATAGSLQGLSQQFQTFMLTGESSVLPYFRALGVATVDASGHLRDQTDILLDVAGAYEKMDPAKATAFGRALGFSSGLNAVLMQGRAATAALLKEQERLGLVTAEDAAAGAKLQAVWVGLMQASTSLGRVIATWLTPAMVKISQALTDLAVWARKHGDFIKAVFIGLSAAATALAVAIALPVAKLALLTAALGAATTAIALVYEDWRQWITGGKAQFGEFYQYLADKWNSIRDLVLPVFEAWKTWIGDILSVWKDGIRLYVALWTGSGAEIRAAGGKLFGDLGKMFLDYIEVIKRLAPVMVSAFKTAFTAAFEWLKGRFNAIWEAAFGRKLFEDVAPTAGGGLGVGTIGGASLPVEAAPGGRGTGAGRGGSRDDRSWWQRHAPKILGGKDARGGGNIPNPGDVGKGASSAEGKENVASWLAFFQRGKDQGGMGLNREKAEAMVAMMQGESGVNLNPRSYNPDDNGGPSGGTAQWHDGRDSKRFSALKAFAQKMGKPWTDREAQQQFWKHEAETTHKKAFARIEGANGADNTLYEGLKGFEVPADIPAEFRKRSAHLNRLRRDRATASAPAAPTASAPSVMPAFKDLLTRRAPDHVMQMPSAGQAAAASIANDSRTSSNTYSNDTRVNEMHVHTAATDADGIARDIGPAMRRSFTAAQANYGQA